MTRAVKDSASTERRRAEKALSAERQRFQTLSEHAPFGMVMIDKDGTFKYINPKFKEIFGYDSTDVPNGKTWFRKAYPDPTHRHQVISAWMKDQKSFNPGEKRPRTFTVTCKDGTEKTVNFITVQLETREYLMTCEDFTERKRAEETLRRSEATAKRMASENSVIAEIGRIISSTLNIEEVYERFTEEVRKLIPFDRIAINIKNLEEDTLTIAYVSGMALPGRSFRDVIPVKGTLSEEIIRTRSSKVIQMEDGGEWMDRFPSLSPSFKAGFRSIMSVPLISKDQVIGVLHFRSTQPNTYTESDLKLAERVGSQIAGVIANAQLFVKGRRVEEALRESEERYRTLFEGSRDAVFITTRQGEFVDFNQALLDLLGYGREELKTLSSQKTYANPIDRSEFQQEIEQRGFVRDYEVKLRKKDGTEIDCLMTSSVRRPNDGSTLGYQGILRDVTEHKRMEEALRDSETRYRTIFENTGTAMVILEEDTSISLANAQTEELTGHCKERAARTKKWTRFIAKDDLERMMEYHHLRRIDPNAAPKNYEFRLIDVKGNVRNIFLTISMIPKTQKSVASLLDITELRRAEDEKAGLQEQLRQSQKMEAVGRLAGGIAHDFNNLLTIIKGYSQLALLEMTEDNPVWENFKEIQKTTDRAADLIRHLLAFSRRQILDTKVLDLNTILGDLDKMLHRVIGEDIELVTKLAEDLWRVKVDPGQMEQVIMNLAVNARDAMPSGGRITIETTNVQLDEVYARGHIAVKPGRYVMLSVSDNGAGMTPEVRERIFEPFFTTKEKGKGTGLGLSTVYGIVKQSGGNIWFYSEPGQGTTCKIYLPTVDEPLDELRAPTIGEELPFGSETILVVEDEEEVRKLALRTLRRQGYSVLEASNGSEALGIWEEQKEPIHLILTDVVMPKMGGKELADRLKAVRPETKVLFTSGFTSDAIVHQGILDSGILLLQKPFTPSSLAQKVRELLDKEAK